MKNCPFKDFFIQKVTSQVVKGIETINQDVKYAPCDSNCALMTDYGVCVFARMLSVMENNFGR